MWKDPLTDWRAICDWNYFNCQIPIDCYRTVTQSILIKSHRYESRLREPETDRYFRNNYTCPRFLAKLPVTPGVNDFVEEKGKLTRYAVKQRFLITNVYYSLLEINIKR